MKLPEKYRNFSEICPEKSIFCVRNCLKESKFFGNFPRKSNFFTRVHDPQILNQIDAAAQTYLYKIKLAYLLLLANIGLFKWNHLTVTSFSPFHNRVIYLDFLFNGSTFQHLKVSRHIISASTHFYMHFGV